MHRAILPNGSRAGIFLSALLFGATVTLAASGVSGVFPSNGSEGVCTDTPLRISFSTPPVAGTGKVQVFDAADMNMVDEIDVGARMGSRTIGGQTQFKYFPVAISGNSADVYLHPGVLTYGKSYIVKIDKGAFKMGSADFEGLTDPKSWHFTTKPAAPVTDATTLTVAADGGGDFCTVQGALDFIPDGNTTPRVLYIRSGAYNEMINFANKHAITFRGEDRKQTVIQYANNLNFNSNRSVFQARNCNDLVIENLTIHNTSPQGASQAEAIILNGSVNAHAIITNVDLYSFQDTLQINGQAFLSHCYIEGDVDFLWGTGPCFFQDCHLTTMRSKGYYVQTRNSATNHGYVFYHCIFDGAPGLTETVLARGGAASEVVLIDCAMTKAVADVGWMSQGGGRGFPTTGQAGAAGGRGFGGGGGAARGPSANIHWAEFNSHDLDGNPIDVSKRLDGSRQLKKPDDAELIANFSNPTRVLGGWEPKLAPAILRQPLPVSVRSAEKAAFAVLVMAVPDANYRWQRDGTDLPGQTGPTCNVPMLSAANAGNYTVIVTNSAGTVTSDVATLKVGGN